MKHFILLMAATAALAFSCNKDSGNKEKEETGWTLPGYEMELLAPEITGLSSAKLSAKVTVPVPPMDGVRFSIAWSTDESFGAGTVTVETFLGIQKSTTITCTATALEATAPIYYTVSYRLDDNVCMLRPKSFISGCVDMGKGVKWSAVNLGASAPEECGGYYAWGETSEKSSYTTANYTYSDNPQNGLPANADAASVASNGRWRMPTSQEFADLINKNNSSCTPTTLNGVKGWKIESKLVPGASIFLPAAGIKKSEVSLAGTSGDYWINAIYDSEFAHKASFLGEAVGLGTDYRSNGLSIRPVLAE